LILFKQYLTLSNNIIAYVIPQGDQIALFGGETLKVVQKNRISITIQKGRNLLYIGPNYFQTLGFSLPNLSNRLADNDALRQKLIFRYLEYVYDPEMGLSILDLGLVKKTEIKLDNLNLGYNVSITMTLTSIQCGMGNCIKDTIIFLLSRLHWINNVHVEYIWHPKWSIEDLSMKAKIKLNLI
jgi:metal-sulfur cluster biosynthetic enzyme